MTLLLRFLGLSKYKNIVLPLLVVVIVVGSGYWLYNAGYSNATTKFELQQEKEFRSTSDKVRKGSNESRKANPTGDPGVALDRLRNRQSNR